ncbi:response regulator transcription factor [Enterococcus faecium]|nr:response regulator transcription factor [Enterococcus faecium]
MIKILIVDDSEIITGGLNILLGMEAGFEIVGCVNNGDKAVEWCRKERIDLVLMDVRMPEMNGVEATKKLQKRQIHK